jgi:predicted AlkP superfamily pyrophosphatase or phosphodiesterase
VLLDPALGAIVDMVLACPEPGVYEAASCDGSVRFGRRDGGFETLEVRDEHPFANQSPATFAGLAAERAHPYPGRRDNAYPNAYEQVAQLFDHSGAPDLCVVHSAAHNWEDQGGHRGEHGSLDVVQSRAPFVLAGKGVRRDGYVSRAARLVDVAPTLAALLGCDPPEGCDGVALTDALDVDHGRPEHVVGFLFDGTNANVLYAMARAGKAPNVARLIELGTAYEWGALASFPTVTLANHTSIITGRFPGHHGILHNAWYDRASNQQIVTNSSATWPWAMQHTIEGTDSLFAAITRTWPDAFTASINEPCDIGAGYSTFDLFRAGDVSAIPKGPDGIPHATERFVRPSKDYAWSTTVDYMCVDQATSIWAGAYRDVEYPHPRFMWCNFTLTDAAFHEGGPYSEIAAASVHDCDARLGDVVDAVERAGVFDDTAFLLVADHGMEETDPAVQGDWNVALRDAGVEFRDEGYGFLYFVECDKRQNRG